MPTPRDPARRRTRRAQRRPGDRRHPRRAILGQTGEVSSWLDGGATVFAICDRLDLAYECLGTVSPADYEVPVMIGGLTMSAKVWTGPGDSTSRLILGLANWHAHSAVADDDLRNTTRRRLLSTKIVVGFDCHQATAAAEAVVLAVADATSGVIFTGDRLLDSDGTILATG